MAKAFLDSTAFRVHFTKLSSALVLCGALSVLVVPQLDPTRCLSVSAVPLAPGLAAGKLLTTSPLANNPPLFNSVPSAAQHTNGNVTTDGNTSKLSAEPNSTSYYSIDSHLHLLASLANLNSASHPHEPDFETSPQVSVALEIILRVSIFIYCCLVIGYLCDEYFVPSLESIGEALNLPSDLIGAILIPFGTSGPEIFSSAVGVFFAENDIGTGAIIGSAVFNILAIPAASGLAATYFIGNSIKLQEGPILRDLTFYIISIIVLILAIKDNNVDLIDASLFAILFIIYISVMLYNAKIGSGDNENKKSSKDGLDVSCPNNLQIGYQSNHVPIQTLNNCCDEHNLKNNNYKSSELSKNCKNKIKENLNKYNEIMINESEPVLQKLAKLYGTECDKYLLNEYYLTYLTKQNQFVQKKDFELKFYSCLEDIFDKQDKLVDIKKKNEYEKLDEDDNGFGFTDNFLLRFLLMPFIVIFSLTMPTRFPGITFILSIAWLSILSYFTVWSISGLSDLVGIPPIISGMTILAAGSAVPDLVTTIIVIKRTKTASMGICAAIASNIFAILLGLGLPWGIQFVLNWIHTGSYASSMIVLESSALPFTSIILLAIVVVLYFTFRICNWTISKRFSLICVLIHVVFVASSISLELLVS